MEDGVNVSSEFDDHKMTENSLPGRHSESIGEVNMANEMISNELPAADMWPRK